MFSSPTMAMLEVMIAGSGHLRRRKKTKPATTTTLPDAGEQPPQHIDHKTLQQEKLAPVELAQRLEKTTSEAVHYKLGQKAKGGCEKSHAQITRHPECQGTRTKHTKTNPAPLEMPQDAQRKHPSPWPPTGAMPIPIPIPNTRQARKEENYVDVFAESRDDDKDVEKAFLKLLKDPQVETSHGPPSWSRRRSDAPARARTSLLTEALSNPAEWEGFIVPQVRAGRASQQQQQQQQEQYLLGRLAQRTRIPVFMRRGAEDWGFEATALAGAGGFVDRPVVRVWVRGEA
ncbi:hypothetical protein F4861DRAFT_432397 [Xylaria intraflava]|nr:hypothetical protein F4861DRAFT_432397 [Xylaria intraflava]